MAEDAHPTVTAVGDMPQVELRPPGQEDILRQILLEEYRANCQFLKHHDDFRVQRNLGFIQVNAILIAGIAAAAALKPPFWLLGGTLALISIVGGIVSLIWLYAQRRNSEYRRFQLAQLRSIEKHLGVLTTFTLMCQAFGHRTARTPEPVHLHGSGEMFSVMRSAQKSSATIEAIVAHAVTIWWVVFFAIGLAITVLSWPFQG